MTGSREFLQQLTVVVRSLQHERGSQATLDRAISAATEIIAPCDFAGISIVHKNGIDTRAASDESVLAMHALQYDLGEGPALDALRDHETVSSPDLATDPRWPSWGPRVATELGVRSLLSYRLFTTRDTLGALNMLSRNLNAFDDNDIGDGFSLAAHVAVAVAAELSDEHMQTGLVSRTVIGQAQGMLMERFHLTADRAFEVLLRLSSHQNIKLHQVASRLVETRELPSP